MVKPSRHDLIEVFPNGWNNLRLPSHTHFTLTLSEVLVEVKERYDELASWAKRNKRISLLPIKKQIRILNDILKNYPTSVNENRKYDVDAGVVVLAVEMTNGIQQTLTQIKRIVVTEEKLRPNKITIPYVCNKHSIEYISIIEMFRVERWNF